MRALLVALPVVALLSPAVRAEDADFRAIVHQVEAAFGIHHTRVPLLGVAGFFTKTTHPGGVKQLDLAIFEDQDTSSMDGERFDHAVAAATNGRWTRMIRVREVQEHTWTCIYVRPEGKDWSVLIGTMEADSAVLVRVKVSPETLLAAMKDPEHAAAMLDSGDDH